MTLYGQRRGVPVRGAGYEPINLIDGAKSPHIQHNIQLF